METGSRLSDSQALRLFLIHPRQKYNCRNAEAQRKIQYHSLRLRTSAAKQASLYFKLLPQKKLPGKRPGSSIPIKPGLVSNLTTALKGIVVQPFTIYSFKKYAS